MLPHNTVLGFKNWFFKLYTHSLYGFSHELNKFFTPHDWGYPWCSSVMFISERASMNNSSLNDYGGSY